ncbi:response regulator [Bosea sp. Tri-44]|uniref:response regulator n=1 Tax=Bosea sp. Tri-44 TaxID=1972137 RepID=UPI00100F469B|nr:response regulator [Bosea sp. Tri-44]
MKLEGYLGLMAGIRVLIVEDDPFIAMDIESAVSEELGDDAELIVVESLSQARRAADQPLDCALLDIDVIGGKTFGIAASLRAKGTPLAFVSGSAPSEVPPELRDVRFVRKPFSANELSRFVSKAVNKT